MVVVAHELPEGVDHAVRVNVGKPEGSESEMVNVGWAVMIGLALMGDAWCSVDVEISDELVGDSNMTESEVKDSSMEDAELGERKLRETELRDVELGDSELTVVEGSEAL